MNSKILESSIVERSHLVSGPERKLVRLKLMRFGRLNPEMTCRPFWLLGIKPYLIIV